MVAAMNTNFWYSRVVLEAAEVFDRRLDLAGLAV